MIPNPDKPGHIKYDLTRYNHEIVYTESKENRGEYDRKDKLINNRDYSTHEYLKLLKQEAQKRMQLMIDIMKSRNVEYDPEPIIKQ
jgi:hypothetical protein